MSWNLFFYYLTSNGEDKVTIDYNGKDITWR